MQAFAAIHEFLAGVRRRIRRRGEARTFYRFGAALVALLLAFPVLAALSNPLRASGFQDMLVVLGSALVVLALFAIALPRRRWRRDEEVARWVGELPEARPVASDLLSAVELERELDAAPKFSRELALALAGETAQRVSAIDLDALVPRGPVRRSARWFLGALALHLVVALAFPRTMMAGWRLLVSPPASSSALLDVDKVSEPIVGDIGVSYEYPAYTGRQPLHVPASSGDILAPRGTKVTIETTALREADKARIVFEGDGAPPPVTMAISGRALRANLVIDKPAAFRFELQPAVGRVVVEAEPHRLDVEADHAPRVELYAPADELEVSSRRRVELAYSVEDDYGLSEITLLWTGASGREEKKVLPAPRAGSRTAQAKFLWDLAEVSLDPGGRVAYRLEARDNDTVSGPNVGISRTFYLRVYSPRERHEEVLRRQEAVFEEALSLLGDRLSLGDDADAQRAALGAGERLVADLTALIALVGQDPMSPKKLKPELEAMRGRLDKLARDEEAALAGTTARRLAVNGKSATELEKDVLALDDWLERQKLEEILSITDEIKQHRDRLKELLADYQRTHSEQARAEIEREMKALERRIAELSAKLHELGGETEDRFMNAQALDASDQKDCLAEVRKLIDAGEMKKADAALDRCSRMLDQQAQMFEDGLRGLRGDKFSDEEKAYSELMNDIADLENAQNDVAEQSERLMDDYKKRAADEAMNTSNPQREKAQKTLDKLQKQLDEVPKDGLTSFGQEELDAMKQRLDDAKRMLDEGDVAEALAMARQADESLSTLEADIEDDVADGQPWSDRTTESQEKLAKADPTMEQLLDELEKGTPSPDQIMSAEDKQKLQDLARKEEGLRERTKRLSQRVQKKAGSLPGSSGQAAQQGLDDAGEQMGRSEKRFGKGDPMGGRDEARGAADKLAALRKQMGRASRPTSVGAGRDLDNEPVKIPGSDQYKPPEEFREDILEAMKKERAPDAYKDQVKRYYEELVK